MKRFGSILLLLFICLNSGALLAQHKQKPPVKDTVSGDAFIRIVDQSLNLYYTDFAKGLNYDSIIDALDYEAGTVPVFTDEDYCKRLAKLNQTSSFGFDCNDVALATIKFFAQNRRNFARIVLGRSRLYFDLYEEKLAEYGLPLELKYLSVIESGLRPQVKSRTGALGLWQFMYATGKQYGLKEDSYIDERMDPVKATDAACRYLKKLYDIYGDWNLALAAYNAGPGNINKAIRRSGGKRTYWEIRSYLPRETQGYVPNFIAATYLLTYHAEHNLLPVEPKIHFYQLDTLCLNRGIHMQTIEKIVSWPVEDIQGLNPVYKTSYIPPTLPRQCLTGPLEKIGLLVSLEDSLYALEQFIYGSGGIKSPLPTDIAVDSENNQLVISNPVNNAIDVPKTKVVTTINYTYHKVKSGESLGSIAAQYNVAIQDLMNWNNLTSARIMVGNLLKIQTRVSTTVENEEYIKAVKDSMENTNPVKTPAPAPAPGVVKKYYTIRSGDTFSRIASKHGITIGQLQRLNPEISPNRIRIGQHLRVK
ncbi:LysM peptidoglycan-binding domain-containing protein [Fluviicola sp.]|jgi:membrane-bound lytic murein transglycosylase D|uniref:lytic transglycosylase domain-containing protein n=1 Tax=Fluviicola sp. TaxID=1917219 RepID=UPI0028360B3F|nr:LysM peptidoglycan-binding domain-containing protein [Fluviicola sp.]MDR0801502.1 transglycosylase SLT domain-containing protein [Fluviicola sp.]